MEISPHFSQAICYAAAKSLPGKEGKLFDRRRIVLYVEDKWRSLTHPGKDFAAA